MKNILLTAALFALFSASGQSWVPNQNALRGEGRAPYRTEFISYDIRGEAEKGVREGSKYYVPLRFVKSPSTGLWEAAAEIPALWAERDIYLRDPGRTGRYVLRVNGRQAGVNTDTYGTNEYYISPLLADGTNRLSLEFDPSLPGGELEAGTPAAPSGEIGGLFIWSQPRVRIFDYLMWDYRDPDSGNTMLAIDLVLANGFNTDETVTAGFDIYDPAGKLEEVIYREVTVPGRGVDTVRFRANIYGTGKFRYSDSNPALYRVMLTLRAGSRNTEYIPVRYGFGPLSLDGANILRDGKPMKIKAVEIDAPSRAEFTRQVAQLKKRGVNTVYALRPQQWWFYDLCAENGIYVVDRAAVECDPCGGDRSPGGTVANDPSFRDRFIDRQQNMFRRNRNRKNVIGWSTASDSGNGYNMYKSYQWLKGVDSTRVVVYPYARGEWNDDGLLPAPVK